MTDSDIAATVGSDAQLDAANVLLAVLRQPTSDHELAITHAASLMQPLARKPLLELLELRSTKQLRPLAELALCAGIAARTQRKVSNTRELLTLAYALTVESTAWGRGSAAVVSSRYPPHRMRTRIQSFNLLGEQAGLDDVGKLAWRLLNDVGVALIEAGEPWDACAAFASNLFNLDPRAYDLGLQAEVLGDTPPVELGVRDRCAITHNLGAGAFQLLLSTADMPADDPNSVDVEFTPKLREVLESEPENVVALYWAYDTLIGLQPPLGVRPMLRRVANACFSEVIETAVRDSELNDLLRAASDARALLDANLGPVP